MTGLGQGLKENPAMALIQNAPWEERDRTKEGGMRDADSCDQ